MGNAELLVTALWSLALGLRAEAVLCSIERRGGLILAVFLRIAAGLALLRALGLYFFRSTVLGALAASPLCVALANGVVLANLGFAFLFWRAGANPPAERSGMYTALLVTGLRTASGTYEMLYLLEGAAATLTVIDMVACLALFVGILNALPGTLRGSDAETQNSK